MTAVPLRGRAIDQDQLEHLFRVTPVVSIMATVGALVAGYPYLGRGFEAPVLTWMAAFVLVSVARIAGSVVFLRQRPTSCSATSWYVWAAASTMAHGVLWGICSLTLSDAGDPLDESILHVVLAAVAMGAAVHLSGFFPLLVSYIAAVLGPLVLRDLWIGGTYHWVLAFLSTMIVVYALLNSRNQSQALAEILRQRRRNAELIEELKRENTVAHQARQVAEQANRSKAQLFGPDLR